MLFGHKKNAHFSDVPIRDNFYQTSSFFPMPVTLISTLADSGQTNLGPYSLCFPHVISGDHAMILIARGSSNTAQNILKRKVASINFIPDDKKYMKNCVELGYPGESTEEKMKNSDFHLIPSTRAGGEEAYPSIVSESIQVFECRWDESAHEVNELEYHFVLRIEKIVMQEHWKAKLDDGTKFPPLPVDYGFRQGHHFWFSDFSRPYAVDIPDHKANDAEHILYQANRIDPDVSWDLEACEKLRKIPKVFLHKALKGIVEEAKKQAVNPVTVEFLDVINDARRR